MMSDTNNGKGISSGKLFKDLFKGRELKILPFVPLAHELAAKVGQLDPRLIWTDPAAIVNSFLSVKDLCGFNALTTSINLSGWQADLLPGGDCDSIDKLTQERAVVVLDVTKRLKHMLKGSAVIGSISAGPLTLAAGVNGDTAWEDAGEKFLAARDQLLQIVKSMGESRIDFFILHETSSVLPESAVSEYLEQARPLWNALRYYDVQPVLAFKEVHPGLVESLATEVSGIAFTGNYFELDLEWLSSISEQKKVCIGLPLPQEVFEGRMDIVETILSQVMEHFKRRRVFLLPEVEIPGETDLKKIQELMQML